MLAFLAVAVVVIVTPGPDTALTIRNTVLGGRRAGVATALGVSLGQAVWTVAASAGVTALLVASEPAFTALKLLGAAYLVHLGAQSLRTARRGTPAGGHGVRTGGGGAPLRQGLLSNLANPKMAVFFSSLLPQFAPDGGAAFLSLLALGLTFCVLTFLWLSAYALLVARVLRPRLRRALDAVAGVALVALGLRLAAEDR